MFGGIGKDLCSGLENKGSRHPSGLFTLPSTLALLTLNTHANLLPRMILFQEPLIWLY